MSNELDLPPDEPLGGGDIPPFVEIEITNDDDNDVQVTTQVTVDDGTETHVYRTPPQALAGSPSSSVTLSVTRDLFTQRKNAAGAWVDVSAPVATAAFKTPADVSVTGDSSGGGPSIALPELGAPFSELAIVNAKLSLISDQLFLASYQPVATRVTGTGATPAAYAWWFTGYDLDFAAGATGTYSLSVQIIGTPAWVPIVVDQPIDGPATSPTGGVGNWFGVRRLRVTLSTGASVPIAQADPGNMIIFATLQNGAWSLAQQPFQIS